MSCVWLRATGTAIAFGSWGGASSGCFACMVCIGGWHRGGNSNVSNFRGSYLGSGELGAFCMGWMVRSIRAPGRLVVLRDLFATLTGIDGRFASTRWLRRACMWVISVVRWWRVCHARSVEKPSLPSCSSHASILLSQCRGIFPSSSVVPGDAATCASRASGRHRTTRTSACRVESGRSGGRGNAGLSSAALSLTSMPVLLDSSYFWVDGSM